MLFPAGVLRKLCAKPIQQLPSPTAYAASMRFSAANAQSSTIQGPYALAEIKINTGAIEDVKIRITKQRGEVARMAARRRRREHMGFCILREPIEYALVADDRERPWLFINCARGVHGRINQIRDDLFVDSLRCVITHGPAAGDRVVEVHYFLS